MSSDVTLLTAFTAGVLSFLSPCVLPVFPAYLAILGRNYYHVVLFLLGFSLVFVAMGATASFFGNMFLEYQPLIIKLGALFMVIMGVHMLDIIPMRLFSREYRPLLHSTFQGPLGCFLLGIAAAAGWTPCTGPILASILICAGMAATVWQGAGLLFVYAMGFSLPFFVFALIYARITDKIKKMYVYLPIFQKVCGITLIFFGMYLFRW